MRLTPNEIKITVFILMAVLAGITVKHWRKSERLDAIRAQAAAPAATEADSSGE